MQKTIEIVLISNCNFSCDYCISGSNHKDNWVMVDGEKKWIPTPSKYKTDYLGYPIIKQVDETTQNDIYIECFSEGILTNNQAMDAKKLLYYIRKNLSGWQIVISGGEPLLYPGIDRLLSTISESNEIILLTNASLIQEHPSILENKKVFLRVGFHPEQRELDEFYENATYIKTKTDNYVINYVHHPRHRERGTDDGYISFLKDNGFKYEVTPFKGEYKGAKYDYEHKVTDWGIISESFTESVPIDEQLKPGETFLTMYADGNIWDCHRKKGINGNIYTGTFTPIQLVDDLPCLGHNCRCDSMRAYRNIDKIKDQIQNPQ